MGNKNESTETIPTNLRPLLILELIAQSGKPVTPTEINRQLGLPKPSIHRLFATLEAEGFIERDIDPRYYAPARRARLLSASLLSSTRLRTARLSILSRIAEELGETCNIALPDRDAMIYLDRVETKWPLRIQLPTGSRVPLYCTASGKMYLSTLPKNILHGYSRNTKLEMRTARTITQAEELISQIDKIRAEGYATDQEEFMADMVAVSVPIFEQHGCLVATLSTHAPKQRLSLETDTQRVVDVLRDGANDFTQLLLK